ncbi:myb-like DNA-binding domain-containing protein [Emericellopsis atlantica]|uniref:Myb-like DNA-binding domain-containing protein n=1 Tax=Emericellopsis atlantica TaxID=2614577 RepID=A0A9P7ZTL5_9HYPO|nr:myb-like DNA-binding domain-containing protein [Emericellopsis atlantica]KAG9257450.1 myb-like DNA-binding domain-containing protein [Emericellopsis atlantica]
MASRYSRYDPDRRSRSPRDRSPGRFDPDRRRPPVDVRSNAPGFPSARDDFGDPPRREPPRGPRALVDPPSGPRGGFGGDFRGGRGRGRGWAPRDDSRDRGRDRDLDFRDRYRDDRNRDRDGRPWPPRDRDHRPPYPPRARSPLGRPRSPPDFRDRDRDGPPGPDTDRPRRNSRDGPPFVGASPPSDKPHFDMPRGRGGFRGRGRGRGDWGADRGRGRAPFDDRGDRYIRSRSQEGRQWNREREERERMDRFADPEPRRDPRDDRDRGPGPAPAPERELFRAKMEARAAPAQEGLPQSRDVSPPPVAPSAPAFGLVPNRSDVQGGPGGMSRPPPTGPRALSDRQGQEPPSGPSRMTDHQAVPPSGPRHQTPKPQRSTSNQWINPNYRRSPQMARAQSFAQPRPAHSRPESSQYDYSYDDRRPRSSASRGAMDSFEWENRRRSHNSVESGEIMNRSDDDNLEKPETHHRRSMDEPNSRYLPSTSDRKPEPPKETTEPSKPRQQGRVGLKSVRFARRREVIQPKVMPDPDTDSDEEDLGDFFNLQIEQTEAELSKLKKPELPLEVVARFASTSHSAMVKILNEPHGLVDVLGEIPKEPAKPNDQEVLVAQPAKSSVVLKEETADVLMADAQTEPPARPKEEEQQARLEETVVQPKATSDGPIESDLMEVDKSTPAKRKTPVPGDQPAEKTDSEAASAQEVIFETTEVTPEKAAAEVEAESRKVAAEESLSTEKKPWAGPDHDQSPKVPSTPSQVEDDGDDEETETEEEDGYVDMDVMRGHMLTPPLEDLPRFDVEPFNGAEDLMTLDDNTDLNAYILQHLEKVHLDKTAEQEHARAQYAEAYHAYLKFTLSDDPVAIKVRDKLSVAAPSTEVVNPATPEPAKPEGRSARRFGSERDLELALQASLQEQTEREEREKKTQSGKHRGDKEAEIPDMYWGTEEQMKEQFFDTSGWVPSNRLVSTWEVLPPTNNFTPEEAELFEKRYLELPKQWGKVAEVVPNRDFGTCIQYYYLMKRELNLKEKLRRQPKKRKKGRGKQRSSALVSELGNGEGDADDNTTETGENGETRRRPRRAAAPTWNFEQPAVLLETESATPVTTPGGRRGASAAGKLDQPDKPDGRKRGRKTAKSSEPKIAKPNPTLAAAPGPGQTLAPVPGRARARSDVKGQPQQPQPQQPQQQTQLQQQRQPPQAQQPFEFQGGMPGDVHRLPAHYEQQQPIGMQPPYSINQPSIQAQQQHQPPQSTQTLDRSQPMPTTSSMAEVIAAPALRPEPPALQQSSLAGPFTHGLTQSDRKNPAQASSYWSVSESNDFPGNLRAFGSDWTAIAAHMGSKTAVMVKNYYVRQKEGGKNEWEKLVREADSQRMRGEKRPDPPIPSTSGRGRRYDGYGNSRPIAAAPGGGIELAPEGVGHPLDGGQPQQVRTQFGAYSVPIAQAPASHQQQQPQPLAPGVPKSMSMQPQPNVSQAMSPNGGPTLRDPSQYNLADREREIERERERHREREMERAQQRVPLPGKSVGPMDTARRGLPGQPLHSSRVEVMPERSQQMDMLHHQQQHRERERERERELEREREREEQREVMARQADRRGVPVKAEPDMSQRAPLDPYSRMGHQHRPEPPRHDPLSLSRHAQEPPRHGPPPAYSSATHSAPPPHRGLLGEQSSARSPPPMGHANGPPTSRPMSALQHRHSSSSAPDVYGQPPPQASTPVPAAAAARAPEPRKSTIMSLLNDDNDAPTPSKRVSDLAGSGKSSTPPPQGVGRSPAASQPPQHMRRDSGPYSPFGRPPSTSAPGMPSLKPTYSGPPSQPSRSALSMSVDPPQTERDYFRQQQGYHPSSANESPQPTPPQYGASGRGQGPPGYPTSFGGSSGGGVSQAPTASSPPPQYPMHAISHSRDMGHGAREQWQHQGNQPPPQHGGWGREPPKSSQPPHQAHAWAGHPGPGTPKASSSSGMWPAPPPPQQQLQQQQQQPPQAHPGMRDERGPHMYGSQQQQQQQQAPPPQHQMQGRYGPPPNRGPDHVPSPAQAYARYASTPGPGPGPGPPPRDTRDMPGRSYTPVSYDGRGHPPPQGYQGDMQMRDPREQPPAQSRDPRDMMGRGLRPPPSEYDRHPENYGR